MKKHYSLLLVMLLGLLGFSASARPVSITVEGDGTVLWGFWGDVTHELHSGLNEFDWDGTYYFINQEGSKIESFMNTSYSTPSAVDTDRYNPGYYTFYVNGNRATPMSFTIVVKKVAEGEDSVYFLLENGSASVYRENKTLGGSAFFEQDLTVGQPAKLPLVDGHSYFIVAGEGLDLDVVNAAGVAQPTDYDTKEFNRYVSKVNASESNTYTITTKQASAKQDSYDITFNIKGGNAVELRHTEYVSGTPNTTKETITNGQTKNFPANDTWAVYPIGDDEFVKVTDGDGNNVELWSSNAYFMINTTQPPVPSVYNIELKAPITEGITLNLQNGEAGLYTYNWGNPELIQALSIGENIVEMKNGTNYVIGAGATYDIVSVTNSAGQEQMLMSYDKTSGYPSNICMIQGWKKDTYTIVTEPTRRSDKYNITFNVTGANAIELQHWSNGYPTSLIETKVVKNGEVVTLNADEIWRVYAVGEDELLKVTNASGKAESIVTYNGKPYFQLNTGDIPSESYTVEIKSNTPAVTDGITLKLENGEASLYTYNWGNPELIQVLNTGDNTVAMKDATNYVIGAGAEYDLVSVTNSAGQEQMLMSYDKTSGYPSNICMIQGWKKDTYTIVTEPTRRSDKYNITFNVTGANAIELQHWSNGYPTSLIETKVVKNGEVVTLNADEIWRVYAVGEDELLKVTNASGKAESIVTYNGKPYFQLNTGDIPSQSYTVEVKAAVVATFIVNIDNPARVEMKSASNETVALVAGANTLTAGVAYTFKAVGDKPFYSVKLDGTALSATDGVYTITAEQAVADAVLDIVANHPIVYYDVTVNVTGDVNALTASYGDANSLNNFTTIDDLKAGTNTVKVQEGYSIRFGVKNGGTINSVNYKVNAEAEAADAEAAADGTFLVGPFGEGGEVNVTMGETETPQIYFSLKVNDPSAIVVKYYNSKSVLTTLNTELTEGVNNLSVPQDEGRIFVQMQVSGVSAANDIKSVKYRKSADLDWTIARLAGNNTYDVYVYVDCQNEIEVEVNKLDIDKKCTVFTDYGVNHGVKLVSAEGRSVSLTGGYQTFDFGESENPFKVEASNPTVTPKVFVNGEMIEGTEVTLVEGALVKIFTGSIEPLAFSFNITAKKDQNDDVKVADMMIDGRTPVEDPTKPLELLYGTEVSFTISAPEDVTYTVKYGDDALQANDYGVYTLWVRAAGAVEIVYTYTGEQPPVEETHLYLVGEVSGNEMKPAFELTEGESSWTASIGELYGKFRIKSEDNSVNLGSNGNPVELNVPYTPTEGAAADMELACGSITDVKISVAKDGYTITITGTVGIAAISRDALDSNAIYFDLQGRRISTENVANGIYIQVANGQARKIAVK